MTSPMLMDTQLAAIDELQYHMDAVRGVYETFGAVGDDHPEYHLDEAYKSILGAIVDPESVNDPGPVIPGFDEVVQ